MSRWIDPTFVPDGLILTPDHRYLEVATGRQVQSVTTVLRIAKIRDAPFGTSGSPEPGKPLSARAENMRKALQRGSDVHRMTRSIDETGSLEDALFDDAFDPADLSPTNITFVAAYDKFLKMSGYTPTAWEVVVWHQQLDYAGRADGVGWLGRDRILLDRKTGSVDRSVWLQLCAYRMAWNALHPTEKIDKTFAVLLKADQSFKLIQNPMEPGDEPFWLAALWMARWHQLQGMTA